MESYFDLIIVGWPNISEFKPIFCAFGCLFSKHKESQPYTGSAAVQQTFLPFLFAGHFKPPRVHLPLLFHDKNMKELSRSI